MDTITTAHTSMSRRRLLGGAFAVAGGAAGAALLAGSGTAVAAGHGGPSMARPMGTGPEPPVEMYFHLLASPVRAYDSRSGSAPDGTDRNTGADDSALVSGELRTVDVSYVLGAPANATGVPETAAAVMCNLTVTSTVGSGWLRVWSHAASEPSSSSINWTASGVTTANLCVSGCSLGYLDVRGGGRSGASTHFLVDVLGYYTPVITGP